MMLFSSKLTFQVEELATKVETVWYDYLSGTNRFTERRLFGKLHSSNGEPGRKVIFSPRQWSGHEVDCEWWYKGQHGRNPPSRK